MTHKTSLLLMISLLAAGVARAERWVAGSTVPAGASVVVGLPPGPVLDDFDDANDPNLWGGFLSTFSGDGGTVNTSFESAGTLNGSGRHLHLTYDVVAPNSYSGCVLQLAPGGTPRDIRQYKYIRFYVRSATPLFKIELSNGSSNPARNKSAVYISDYLELSGSTWSHVTIPLAAFANLDSFANVTQLAFVFENGYVLNSGIPGNETGAVDLDHIFFGDDYDAPVRVDSFGDHFDRNALGGNVGSFGGDGGVHRHEYFSTGANSFPGAVRSTYNVTSGYAGIYFIFGGGADGSQAQAQDFSSKTALKFSAKFENQIHFPEVITIELVDGAGKQYQYHLSTFGIHSFFWNFVTIPLSSFTGLEKSSIRQLNIVYEGWRNPGRPTGSVFYDDIRFE